MEVIGSYLRESLVATDDHGTAAGIRPLRIAQLRGETWSSTLDITLSAPT
jgi:hypothetical protein